MDRYVNDGYGASIIELHPGLTKSEFKEFTAEAGEILRFRQLGDSETLGKGKIAVGVQFAGTRIDDAKRAWSNTTSHPTANDHLSGTMSFPRIVARFGVSDRVDVGVMGGLAPRANYGLAGADVRVALIRQGPASPVSVLVRPSVAFLVAPSQVIVGNLGVDLSISRAFGPLSPYAGIGASTSGAVERSSQVRLDAVDAGDSLAYAGVSYRWRAFVLSTQVEKGALVRYAFGIGTRF